MVNTDVQVYCRNGRRLLPDNESDIRMLLNEPENLMRVMCSTDIASLTALFDAQGDTYISVTNDVAGTVSSLDNGSGIEEPVELMANTCPAEKMMCYDKALAADIIMHFCKTGNLYPDCEWTIVSVDGNE